MKKTKRLAVTFKILSRRIQKNTAKVNAKNEHVKIIKQKCFKKFYRFDLIDNDPL